MIIVERLLASLLPPGLAALGFLSFAGGLSLFAKAVKQEILDELRASAGGR